MKEIEPPVIEYIWIPCDCVYKSVKDMRILKLNTGYGCSICKGTGRIKRELIKPNNTAN